jgi:hypothetical protein
LRWWIVSLVLAAAMLDHDPTQAIHVFPVACTMACLVSVKMNRTGAPPADGRLPVMFSTTVTHVAASAWLVLHLGGIHCPKPFSN